jgi:hypothetical protein
VDRGLAIRFGLGNRWAPAGTIVQVFGAVALLQAASTQVGVIHLARNATSLLLRWALIATPVIVGSFAVGLLGGLTGVAWAYLAANVALFYPCWQIPGRLIGLSMGMVWANLAVVLGWAFGIAGLILGLRIAIHVGSLLAVGLLIAGTSVLYWAGALILDRDLRDQAFRLVGLTAPGRRRAATGSAR